MPSRDVFALGGLLLMAAGLSLASKLVNSDNAATPALDAIQVSTHESGCLKAGAKLTPVRRQFAAGDNVCVYATFPTIPRWNRAGSQIHCVMRILSPTGQELQRTDCSFRPTRPRWISWWQLPVAAQWAPGVYTAEVAAEAVWDRSPGPVSTLTSTFAVASREPVTASALPSEAAAAGNEQSASSVDSVSGLSSHPCSARESVRSGASTTPTSIRFTNHLAGPVQVYWIDPSGHQRLHRDLRADETYNQPTYLTHAWMITATGDCVGIWQTLKNGPGESSFTVEVGSSSSPASADPPSSGTVSFSLERIAGKWGGIVEQLQPHQTYKVVLLIAGRSTDGTVGTIEYPSLNCGGRLGLQNSADAEIRLNEAIDHGNCVKRGTITLTPGPLKSQLTFRWYFPNGQLGVEGTVQAAPDVERQGRASVTSADESQSAVGTPEPAPANAPRTAPVTGARVERPQSAPALNASALSGLQVELTWAVSANDLQGHSIERSSVGGTGFQEIARVDAGMTTYGDTGLTPGSTYAYKMRSYNSAGYSGYSPSVTVTTLPIVDPSPIADVPSIGGVTWQGKLRDEKHALIDLARKSYSLTAHLTQDGGSVSGEATVELVDNMTIAVKRAVIPGTVSARIAGDSLAGTMTFRGGNCTLNVLFTARIGKDQIKGRSRTTGTCGGGTMNGEIDLKRKK